MSAWDDPDFIRDEAEANPPDESDGPATGTNGPRQSREANPPDESPDHDPDATVESEWRR